MGSLIEGLSCHIVDESDEVWNPEGSSYTVLPDWVKRSGASPSRKKKGKKKGNDVVAGSESLDLPPIQVSAHIGIYYNFIVRKVYDDLN